MKRSELIAYCVGKEQRTWEIPKGCNAFICRRALQRCLKGEKTWDTRLTNREHEFVYRVLAEARDWENEQKTKAVPATENKGG